MKKLAVRTVAIILLVYNGIPSINAQQFDLA